MPSDDWTTETSRGEQSCYNVMVRSDNDDWEPNEEFIRYSAVSAVSARFSPIPTELARFRTLCGTIESTSRALGTCSGARRTLF